MWRDLVKRYPDLDARQILENLIITRSAKALPLQLLSPLVDLLAGNVVPPRDIRHRPAVPANLIEDFQFLLVPPTTSPLDAQHNLVSHDHLRRIRRRYRRQ